MNTEKEQEYLDRIAELDKEIKRTHHKIKKDTYGLHWLDVPEAFEDDVEKKLPILKEVKEKAIINDDGKPTHILIEGDNYHALTCLNYTHKGKIDVIYIDPPYNTGSDGFRYKDKRFLTEFPDGTEVPKEHPLRHSYWLSFMKKRMEICRDLLKESGVIIISIDDNEFAQLKLLCDQVFSNPTNKDNFIGNIIRNTNSTKSQSNFFSISYDYAFIYAKDINYLTELVKTNGKKWEVEKNNIKAYKKVVRDLKNKNLSNEEITKELKELTRYPRFIDFVNYWYLDDKGIYAKFDLGGVSNGNENPIINPLTTKIDPIPPGGFRFGEEKLNELIEQNRIHFHTDGSLPRLKRYLDENPTQRPKGFMSDDQRPDNRLLKSMGIEFDNPKQMAFMKRIISIFNKDAIILDYFAGSGTTAHAVMELNEIDDGKRQFIISTNDEENICSEVCYPRVSNIINGYLNRKNNKSVEGIGNSMKYFETEFVGEHNILGSNDSDKTELAHHAGEMLAIAENTLYEMEEYQTDFYQFFRNEKHYTAVYFREELEQFEEFREKIMALENSVTVYVFSWGENEFADQFYDRDDIEVKPIPQPILEVYKTIYNLSD